MRGPSLLVLELLELLPEGFALPLRFEPLPQCRPEPLLDELLLLLLLLLELLLDELLRRLELLDELPLLLRLELLLEREPRSLSPERDR